MKIIVFAVLISVGLPGKSIVNSQQPITDFCAAGLCPNGVSQTGCNNNGALSAACPAGAQIIALTTADKQSIVIRHNQRRHSIASGNMPAFQPAIRMATIRWNAELATLAQDNANTCVFAHDKCRATTQFKWSGQNMAQTWWSGADPADLIASVVLPQINAWWSENVDTTMAQINSYPATTNATIGHFTVMTAEKNTAVGCGLVKYIDPTVNNWNTVLLVCNYARTNIIGLPLYRPGAKASLCTTGTNPNFPALCSLSEPYNVNAA